MRAFAIFLVAALSGAAYAQTGAVKDHPKGHGHDSAAANKQAKPHKGVGVVKSVDREKGTVTLAHEPIASLRWPAMTMRFIARDKKMLEKLTPGKKVEFEFVEQGGDYLLTQLK
jgi:Cu(I)/Ag(I) efflux system protein CusF